MTLNVSSTYREIRHELISQFMKNHERMPLTDEISRIDALVKYIVTGEY